MPRNVETLASPSNAKDEDVDFAFRICDAEIIEGKRILPLPTNLISGCGHVGTGYFWFVREACNRR